MGFSGILIAQHKKNGEAEFRVVAQHFLEVSEAMIISALKERRKTDRLLLLAMLGAIAFGISFVAILA